jgi:2-polyprenyl-3-methyl-5-hydroxy-6-metoxy-1,4-benzoquinol methylase
MLSHYSITCPSCKSNSAQHIGACYPAIDVWNSLVENNGDFYRCLNCKLAFRWPQLEPSALANEYLNDASDKYSYVDSCNTAWQYAYREIKKSENTTTTNMNILDVGCYHGRFLSGLSPEWKRFGIEPSEAASMRAQINGVQVIEPKLRYAEPAWTSAFEFVTMFDVLEHLENPAEGIRQALSYVKPGGKCIFSTGNVDSWPFRILANYHWYLESHQHLAILSPKYVENVIFNEKKCKFIYHSIPHQRLPRLAVITELFQAIYFKGRISRGAWLPFLRMMHLIPGFMALRHKSKVPYLMHLRDHFLGVITKE